MKYRKTVAILMTCAMALALAVPAFASPAVVAPNGNIGPAAGDVNIENNTNYAEGDGYQAEDNGDHEATFETNGTEVLIMIEGAGKDGKPDIGTGDIGGEGGYVSVTVPATLPILFKNTKGQVGKPDTVVPTNWTVKNNDVNTAVYISSMSLTGKDGWKVASKTTDMKLEKADTKMIKFSAGFQGGTMHQVAGDADAETASTYDIAGEELSIAANTEQVFAFEVERTVFTKSDQVSAYSFALDFNWHGAEDSVAVNPEP